LKNNTPKEIIFFEDRNGKTPFTQWLNSLDSMTRSRIEQRILRVSLGNYGDYKSLREGICELRFKFGSGYRIYFGEDGDNIVVLIKGGDKSSQRKDIKKAIEYWKEYQHD
jgi:putative addiction module killer protein